MFWSSVCALGLVRFPTCSLPVVSRGNALEDAVGKEQGVEKFDLFLLAIPVSIHCLLPRENLILGWMDLQTDPVNGSSFVLVLMLRDLLNLWFCVFHGNSKIGHCLWNLQKSTTLPLSPCSHKNFTKNWIAGLVATEACWGGGGRPQNWFLFAYHDLGRSLLILDLMLGKAAQCLNLWSRSQLHKTSIRSTIVSRVIMWAAGEVSVHPCIYLYSLGLQSWRTVQRRCCLIPGVQTDVALCQHEHFSGGTSCKQTDILAHCHAPGAPKCCHNQR